MEIALFNPTVVVPGLNNAGSYDDRLLTQLSEWLEKRSLPDADQRLHIHERGMLCYRIFFLERGVIEAMFTLSLYYDPFARARDPHKALWRSGQVVEVIGGERTGCLPFMFETVAAIGYHLELGCITVPAALPVQHRLLAAAGYQPYATGIQHPDGSITTLFRMDLRTVSPSVMTLRETLHLV